MFTTGYQAMLGTIVSLADKDTTLVLDSYSHACILDGTFLAAGVPGRAPEVRFFNHNSAKSLERILKTRERKNALVCVEGVYSLDGDKAHLAEFVEICERYDAVLVVDDAHGTGTLGERGTGILEETGLRARVPVVVSTFSKTFGGIGGLLLGSEEVVDLVKHNARSFLFSASLPVPIVAAASTILDMLEDGRPGDGARAAPEGRLHPRQARPRPASISARATRTSCRSCAARSARRSSCTSRCSSAAC